jgi:hypothetical protein
MNTTSAQPSRFCFARVRLAAFWIVWFTALWILSSRSLLIAVPLFLLAPLIRPDSYAERAAAFRHPTRWVPLVLLLAFLAVGHLLPEPYRESVAAHGRTDLLLATAFLLYYFILDLRLFLRLPPLRSP